ncbi:MAG: hypothetical protein GY761_19005 [Hyphomicrobiales bacterium]|nr:hypothetical protein [Hyphomicrobiales bacterium]
MTGRLFSNCPLSHVAGHGNYALTGGYDGIIAKWEAATGKMIRIIHRHGWGINVLKWLPGKNRYYLALKTAMYRSTI